MKKIVIIDDEQDILEIMHFNLESYFKNQVQIEIFSNPFTFIQESNLNDIDILISDINMPEMTGIELYKEIRSSGYNKSFIFHTGYMKAYLKDLMGIKDCYLFSKPTNFDLLYRTVENIFMIEERVDNLLDTLLKNASQLSLEDFEKKYKLYLKLVNNIKVRQVSVEKLAS